MHTWRFSYAFIYRYYYASSGCGARLVREIKTQS